jgi:hypothetical protein
MGRSERISARRETMKRWLGWTVVLGLGGALATGCVAREEQDTAAREDQGPYTLSQPQPVPRERRPAPLGVGSGMDSARKMAMDQLKSYEE